MNWKRAAPVAVSIRSSDPPKKALERLDQAVRENDYGPTDRNSPGFYRMSGEVFRRYVTLAARPYAMPGIRAGSGAMALSFVGEVVPDGSGSELSGSIEAPVDPFLTVVGAILSVVFLLGALVQGPGVPALVFAVVVAVTMQFGFAWIRSHNQRMAMRSAGEIVRFLRSVLPE
jgi:hypothetical protein